MSFEINKTKIGLVLASGPPGAGKSTFTSELSSCISRIESQIRLGQELTEPNSLFINSFAISFDHVIDKNLENQLVNNKKYASSNSDSSSSVHDWKSARSLIHSLVKLFIKYLNSSDLNELSMSGLNELINSSLDESASNHEIKDRFLGCIEAGLPKAQLKPDVRAVYYVILLDDLFYYESMRYAYFKLAIELECGYFAFCFRASELSFLLARNQSRELSQQLDESIIENVYAKFECPKDWEVNFSRVIDVDASFRLNSEYLISSACLIVRKMSEFSSHLDKLKLEVSVKAEQSSKLNLVHESDLMLRKLIGTRLSGLDLAKSEKVKLAAELNKAKTNILNSLKLNESENYGLICLFNENRFDLIERELELKLFRSELN